ncbi:MAG: ATP-binding protein [Anaerolineales bacterium]|nr:ATP-binding protein [Anaerolineales bacterium]
MYVPRSLQPYLQKVTQQFPVLLLTGARQVGKTTLLRHLQEGRSYVTLDDPLVLTLAKTDPALFMQRFPVPVLIDEIQYAPELLPYIKMAVDRDRTPGMFWLTGSQQFHLMKGVSESLAGRVAILHLSGLSRREMQGEGLEVTPFVPTPEEITHRSAQSRITLQELYRLIWRGALPAIALNPEIEHVLFYGSYVQTYLQRDVRDLARVGDEMAFLRFLRAAAARTGQLLNLTELARDADIAPNTVKNWLSILQATGTIYLLEPYHTNVTQRLIKTPKLYFLDTGLVAYLTEWASPETLEAGAMSGSILETWIMGELLKSYWHTGRRPPFYFFRDKDQREIDLLLVQDGMIYPLEIKKTASPGRDDVRHFGALERLGLPVGPGGVICLAEQGLPLTATAQSIPVWML